MSDIEYESNNKTVLHNCVDIIEKVQAAEIAQAKHNKCNRGITEFDRNKRECRRAIEAKVEAKRFRDSYETLE